jgi:hypothetical protein
MSENKLMALAESDRIETERKRENGQKKVIIELDGNEWFAHHEDFVNIQKSKCGFGKTRAEALQMLEAEERGCFFK